MLMGGSDSNQPRSNLLGSALFRCGRSWGTLRRRSMPWWRQCRGCMHFGFINEAIRWLPPFWAG